jgi:hypothetical protein
VPEEKTPAGDTGVSESGRSRNWGISDHIALLIEQQAMIVSSRFHKICTPEGFIFWTIARRTENFPSRGSWLQSATWLRWRRSSNLYAHALCDERAIRLMKDHFVYDRPLAAKFDKEALQFCNAEPSAFLGGGAVDDGDGWSTIVRHHFPRIFR